MKIHASSLLIATILVLGQADAARSEDNWSRWRGNQQNGHSADSKAPLQWSDGQIRWQTDLPGGGQSSPVVWGSRIFLTAEQDNGVRRLVLAVSRDTGKIEWQRQAWEGEPEPSHNMNGWASATCATDGEHVIAFFGRGGLHCYTVEGDHVWSLDLGRFESPWGTAACPVLWNGLVIQNCDADTDAFLAAFDVKTGKEVWRTARPNYRGWSTPVIIPSGDQVELVVNGQTGTMAYDPATGDALWNCPCPRGRGTPTVTPHDGRLFVVNGLGGGGAYSLKPGGSGEITDSHRIWFSERRTRDLPSPAVVGQTMLVMSLRGAILSGYDISNGKELWKERVGGQISSSPVCYRGHAIFIAEDGTGVVVNPQAESIRVVGRNELTAKEGEIFRAAATPNRGELLIRSNRRLICISGD